MKSNPWASATAQALQVHKQALDQVVGQVAGKVGQQDQAARYLHFKQNPQDLLTWSAQQNGPERAMPEANRYLSEMRKRYGS
tara:strand:- start:2516 stop:2761 length:246 start_codon:yes stop_codon:yes gene_type:complete